VYINHLVSNLGKILFVIYAVLIVTVGCSKQASSEQKDANSDAVGKGIANTALQVSELDVSALSGINEKLKGACARNKYGLTEEDCIQKIDERKETCMQQTAQKYPGQLANVDRMQEVISSHVECLLNE